MNAAPHVNELLGEALGEMRHLIGCNTFTRVQEKVLPSLLRRSDNAVVAAPTGSGKTLLLEVAIMQLFRSRFLISRAAAAAVPGQPSSDTQRGRGASKAVYVSPIKALANEKFEHWTKLFAFLSVVIETGDQERERSDSQDSLQSVSNADIIITTAERWDSITRRWKERTILDIVNSVALLLLDEIHTVHEERGSALEAMVSRMKTIKLANASRPNTQAVPIRLIAVSGTLPNIEDIAAWLEVPPAMIFRFSDADRPVPLTVRTIGFARDSSNPFIFGRFLSFKIFGLVRQYSEGKPAIVFCASRNETVLSAQRLVQDIQAAAASEGKASQLEPSAEVVKMASTAMDRNLCSCLHLGIAFHHAALAAKDRWLVERMFREQYISVVCTTSTLALGVNLPAHLVIVKGTTLFKNGKCEDIPTSEVAQMCGRAGRPGLDDHGVAIILTTDDKVKKYDSLQSGSAFTTVESQLHRHMIEHVNAEVVLRTIHSFASAVEWVKTTFFWIRLQKNPRAYGLSFATKAEELQFDPARFVESLMERVFSALHVAECIDVSVSSARLWQTPSQNPPEGAPGGGRETDRSPTTFLVQSTAVGRAMARLYILFDTVQAYNKELNLRSSTGETCDTQTANGGEQAIKKSLRKSAVDVGRTEVDARKVFSLRDMLTLLCSCSEEFREDLRLRQGDRGPLNIINKATKFPLQTGRRDGREVREGWHKPYLLIQCRLAHIPINEVSLRNDAIRLWSLVPRLARFLVEYAESTDSYSLSFQANQLLRCVERHLWPDGLVLRQIDGVTEATARSLALGGCRQLNSVLSTDQRKLESMCSRLPPYGAQLQKQVADLPSCRLTVERLPSSGVSRYRVSVVPTHLPCCTPPTTHRSAICGFLLIAGSVETDRLLLHRYISLRSLVGEGAEESTVTCEFSADGERDKSVDVKLLADHWVGHDVALCIAPEMKIGHIHRSVPDEDATAPADVRVTKQPSECRSKVISTETTEDSLVDEAVAEATSYAKDSFAELIKDLTYIEGPLKQRRKRRLSTCPQTTNKKSRLQSIAQEHHDPNVNVPTPRTSAVSDVSVIEETTKNKDTTVTHDESHRPTPCESLPDSKGQGTKRGEAYSQPAASQWFPRAPTRSAFGFEVSPPDSFTGRSVSDTVPNPMVSIDDNPTHRTVAQPRFRFGVRFQHETASPIAATTYNHVTMPSHTSTPYLQQWNTPYSWPGDVDMNMSAAQSNRTFPPPLAYPSICPFPSPRGPPTTSWGEGPCLLPSAAFLPAPSSLSHPSSERNTPAWHPLWGSVPSWQDPQQWCTPSYGTVRRLGNFTDPHHSYYPVSLPYQVPVSDAGARFYPYEEAPAAAISVMTGPATPSSYNTGRQTNCYNRVDRTAAISGRWW